MRPSLAALLIALVALPVAAAAPQVDVARLQAEYRDEQTRARRLRADAADASAALADLERQLAEAIRAGGTEDPRIAAQRARLRELGQREAALLAELSDVRTAQARILSAQQTLTRHPPPPLVTPSAKVVDTVRATLLMRGAAPELAERARAITARQTELARIRRLAALNSEGLFVSDSARTDRRARLEAAVARQTAQRGVLRAEAEAAERSARALARRLDGLGAAVPPADPEAIRISARLPGGRSRLTPPVDGAPSTRFGEGSTGWRWRRDGGEARSPAPAVVAHVGPLSGWGTVVILELGPGWRAVVAGLDTADVDAGQRVAEGQALGRAGVDGEIVFELRRDERPVDPAPFLR